MSDFFAWLATIEGAIIWDGACLVLMVVGCIVIDILEVRRG